MPILRNQRREALCREIVRGAKVTSAYISAGYSANSAQPNSSKLLSKDIISARILELKQEAAAGAVLTAQQVLEEFTKLAIANAADYVNDDGTMKPITALTRAQASAIIEIEVIAATDKKPARYRYKLADKRAALEALARHYGLFHDKVEHNLMQNWEIAVMAVAEARLQKQREQQQPPEGNPVVH
jgi:phage terminase small subunit